MMYMNIRPFTNSDSSYLFRQVDTADTVIHNVFVSQLHENMARIPFVH